jgi:DNA helicase-2/ATP-dependent DNA helicase PcrA
MEAENPLEKILAGVTEEQRKAIEHLGSHARLLAGPGTGKTHVLTRKVLWLILKQGVSPKTF